MSTTDLLVGLDDIRAAAERVAPHVHRTPLLSSLTAARFIAAATGVRIADDRLFLKAENLQKTGSFKARGMANRILTLDPDQAGRGAVSVSAGNAAQAYAWAAREAGVPMTVCMAATANPTKIEACRGYGAEVVLEGTHVGDAFRAMERLRDERGLLFLHPFEDPFVIAGHGTVGLELVEDLPDVDVLVVGIGGGGLMSGVAAAVKEQRPRVRIYGVEPTGAAAMTLAYQAGRPVEIQPQTVADGLAAPFVAERTIAMTRRYVDEIVLLEDAEILSGVRFAIERLKQALEPAGAAALAALLHGRIPLRAGDRVAVVASGGNLDINRLGELIAGAAPLPSGDTATT